MHECISRNFKLYESVGISFARKSLIGVHIRTIFSSLSLRKCFFLTVQKLKIKKKNVWHEKQSRKWFCAYIRPIPKNAF